MKVQQPTAANHLLHASGSKRLIAIHAREESDDINTTADRPNQEEIQSRHPSIGFPVTDHYLSLSSH
jgi:hypothetical protein